MKFFQRISLVCVLMVSILLASGSARAQYTNPYTGNTWNNPMSSFLDTVIRNNMQMQNLMTQQFIERSMLEQSLSRSGMRRTSQQKKEADRFAQYRGTMFKMSKNRIMPKRLAAMFAKNSGKAGKERAELEDQLTAVFVTLVDFYDKRSKQQKAPPNDLARTLAYCIALNYAYATEQDVSAGGLVALRSKIRTALTSDKKFRALSDVKKQEMSEGLIILSHFVALGYDQSKEAKQTQAMKNFKKLAAINLQSILGVPPARVRLEKTGLVVAAS
jgi:hypothetical protein